MLTRRGSGSSSGLIPYFAIAVAVSSGLSAAAPRPAPTAVRLGAGVSSPVDSTAVAFTGVTVVDVATGQLHPRQTVLIVGRRIAAVGAARQVKLPPGARIVPARGKYLIPGLWDMHSHPLAYPQVFYPLLLANGVTGIREPGSTVPLATLLQRRREVAAGTRVGPRAVVSGGYLEDGNCDIGDEQQHGGLCNRLTSPAEARRLVDSLKAAGADFLKTHNFMSADSVARALYVAVAEEARRVGIPFGGHVDAGLSAVEMADLGATLLDHYQTWGDNGRLPACFGDSASVAACAPIAARLRARGTWLVTTLAIHAARAHLSAEEARRNLRYWPDSVRSKMAACDSCYEVMRQRWQDPFPGRPFAVAQQAGLPLVTGTDNVPMTPDIAPGFSLHTELALLVTKGLTPLGALQAATLNPAKALRATDSLGTVEQGKLADLVLLDADPLADIANTTKVRAVVADGRYYDRTALDSLLAALERAGR